MKNIRAGIAQLVEPHVANVIVAGSSPVSRSKNKYETFEKCSILLKVEVSRGGIAKRLRQRSAKPLFTGSNPVAASK